VRDGEASVFGGSRRGGCDREDNLDGANGGVDVASLNLDVVRGGAYAQSMSGGQPRGERSQAADVAPVGLVPKCHGRPGTVCQLPCDSCRVTVAV